MSNTKKNYFTLDFYEGLLKKCIKTLKVKEYANYDSGVILRHDVDFSLDLAFEFSRIEKRNSNFSSYYILTTSDLYNPFSRESKKIIKKMLDDGFEIGLHFDPTLYKTKSFKELENKFLFEINALETVFGFKVKSYSLHNPSIHGQYPQFSNFISTYNNDIFYEDCYLSDSMFSFGEKNPVEFVEKSKNQIVQFLTHPIHFFSEGRKSYEMQMIEIVKNYYRKFDTMFSVNKVYKMQKRNYQIKI